MKRNDLLTIVTQYPRRTANEYAYLTNRPKPSVRRDLSTLAYENLVRRVREGNKTLWEAMPR